jgi:hypothetical protein
MADEKPLSRWARAHGKRPPQPPYTPRVEPEPQGLKGTDDELQMRCDDDSPLVDMELSETEKIRRNVEDRGLGAAVDIGRDIINILNNYKPKGA